MSDPHERSDVSPRPQSPSSTAARAESSKQREGAPTDGALSLEDTELLELSRDLRRLASHLVSDPAGADDVVQEAWLAALGRPLGEVRTLAEWMRTVVRRIAQRRVRRDRRRADVEALVAVRDEAGFDAELDERLATHKLLRDAVGEVSQPSRAVLVAHYFDGRTLESVAALLRRPLETVRTQRRRGLAELRVVLDRRHKGDRSTWVGVLRLVSAPAGSIASSALRRLALGTAATLLVASTIYFAFLRPGDPPRAIPPPALAAAQPSMPTTTVEPDVGAHVQAREPLAPPAESATTEAEPAGVPPRRLAVRVVAADGLPVPDALVSTTASLDLPDLPAQNTDGHGITTIEIAADRLMRAPIFPPPVGGVAIRARADGHAYSRTYYVPIPEDGGSFELVLGGPEQIVDLRVVDEEGQPVAGARVEVDKRRRGVGRGDDGVLSTESAVGAITDEEGRARLANLERGEHELDVRAAGFVLRTTRISTVDPHARIDVRLERGATLVGDVRRADGSAVVGATVFAPQPEFHREAPPGALTDADGRFRLSGLPPGSTRIFARGPESADGRANSIIELAEEGETFSALRLLAEPPLGIRVQDVGSGTVAGIIVLLDSRPDSGPPWRTIALIDASGACSIDAFPSEVLDCTVLRGSDGHVYRKLAIDARRPQEFLVQLDVGTVAALGSLRGFVFDARGVPLTTAYVREIRDDEVLAGGWLVDATTGAYESTLVAAGLARWIVVAREGVAELGFAPVAQGTAIDLGTINAQAPGLVRITWASAPSPDTRLELRHRTPTKTGVAEGRVHELPAELREFELLPYDYVLRILDASGSPRADVPFRVESKVAVDVVLQ